MMAAPIHITRDLCFQAVAKRCRENLFFFVRTFWGVIIQEEPVYNWHMEYLCDELQKAIERVIRREEKEGDIIINIPPGTSKSTIVSVMLNAWAWTIDPSLKFISNSYSSDLSIELATKTKDIIESDRYKTLFGNVAIRPDKSGKQHYETTKGGFRYATSTGATITGYHGHIIINDDPVNPKQANSEVMRKTANEHIKTLSSRKVDKKVTLSITVMQRLHEKDVTGQLLSSKGDKIKHICLPAELSDMVKPIELKERYIDGLLDPNRLDRNSLSEMKNDLGSRQYSCQMEQNPIADGGNIIQEKWFKHISYEQFRQFRKDAKFPPIEFYLDTAYTENTENDPTGVIATCMIGNSIYIMAAEKVYMTFPQLIRWIPEWTERNGYDNRSRIHIEPKANGISIVDQLKESTRLNVIKTPSPRDSKETRAYGISPAVESGRCVIVDGAWNDEFIGEVCGFPTKEHDEYMDVLVYAVNDNISKPRIYDSSAWEREADIYD